MPEFIDTNARLLNLLLEQGFLSVSSIQSKASKEVFSALEQTGVIQKKRKGAGNQYQLFSESSLVEFIKSKYPSGLYRLERENIPRRVKGILERKNSKSLSKLDYALISLRGNTPIKQNNKVYRLEELTTQDVFLSLKLTNKISPEILHENRTIITVENPTVFIELERMVQLPWNIAIYTGGKISNILLEQLSLWEQKGHNVVHFGDYDYVGLHEFARILQFCPKAKLYSPAKLTTELFQQYGNTLLLEKQVNAHKTLIKVLSKLPESLGRTQLITTYNLLQENAKGLEQESFY